MSVKDFPLGLGLLRLAIESKPEGETIKPVDAQGETGRTAADIWKRTVRHILRKKDVWEDLLWCTEPEVAIEHVYDVKRKR